MIIMAVDLGRARTGLAVCDSGEMLASPLCVIEEHNEERLVNKICEKAKESGAQLLCVGLPRNMDGSEGESALHARELAALISDKSGLETVMRDERCTTITAHGYLNTVDVRGKKRKAVVDAVAATIILQDYLDYRRNNKKNEEN